MNASQIEILLANYRWDLSLIAAIGIAAVTFAASKVLMLVPAMREAAALNQKTLRKKMERPAYAANQAWNRKWGLLFWAVIFVFILPFCLTAEPQPLWNVLLDIAVILMFYDFFYYVVHRFLFHDGGFMGGPLMWVHAVHHRQHNPCRGDSSFIHPLEVALGLGLYVASIVVLSLIMGRFHVAAIVFTWVAFSQINLHNHDLWPDAIFADRFPFRYLSTMSKMHHHHHARFTGGNYATISLLYDWLFGTLDYGKGDPRSRDRRPKNV